ncbi:acyl-CoA dehydrogenase family protein [Dongia deserti]|uniref:acyl-CoA dehydrogenase family protein n=1 Tax=Dongia deserti TaxID=2268030 RepID=UPI000E650A51|nr:acyl-CoA dehydrogenase family protein [Dongia deserti]
MLPTFTDEQRLLKESLERFRQQDYSFEKRKGLLAKLGSKDDPVWAQFAELGWLAATLPEDYGGLGGSHADLALLMEQFGRGLVTSPFVPTVVIGATAVRLAGSEAQKAAILPGIAEGRTKLALAYLEAPGQLDPSIVATRVRSDGDHFIITGNKIAALYANVADHLLVSARMFGQLGDHQGISLFIIPANAKGLAIGAYRTHDDGWAADLHFDQVHVPAEALVGSAGSALDTVEASLDAGAAAICAEAVGAMWCLHDMTLDYIKVRKQFGATIGSFQAIQHRMVNMYMKCQLAQSMALAGIAALDSSDPVVRRRAVSAAKVQVGRAARHVGEEAVQLHGGIAMTDEYAAGHYFKRLTMIRLMFGDEEYHLRRYCALSR